MTLGEGMQVDLFPCIAEDLNINYFVSAIPLIEMSRNRIDDLLKVLLKYVTINIEKMYSNYSAIRMQNADDVGILFLISLLDKFLIVTVSVKIFRGLIRKYPTLPTPQPSPPNCFVFIINKDSFGRRYFNKMVACAGERTGRVASAMFPP